MSFAIEQKKFAAYTSEAKGYRMIVDFDIENFRCFKHAKLRDLRRVNLIVGDNASGKTALLEALYLSANAQPMAASFIRTARNRPTPFPGTEQTVIWDRAYLEAYWEDLFYDCSHSNIIKANFTDSAKRNIVVEISYGNNDKDLAIGLIPPLIFQRKGLDGDETCKVRLDDRAKLSVEGVIKPLPNALAICSTFQFNFVEIVNFYSSLLKHRLENIVIKAFRKEFPQVIDILPLPDGPAQSLFVTLESMKNTRVPLAVVSAGAARYLYFLSAIAVNLNGIVLIDEIENGLYWNRFPKIWKVLRSICRERDVQLFVTTHSNECLQSLMPAMEENVDDFSLIRTEISNGEYIQRQFYGNNFKAALEMHGEIR